MTLTATWSSSGRGMLEALSRSRHSSALGFDSHRRHDLEASDWSKHAIDGIEVGRNPYE